MTQLDELSKLADLKKKGVINAEEFKKQKDKILANVGAENGAKSQLVYALLGFFLGCFGIHNFYAGYISKGVWQLILTLLSPFTLFISLLAVEIWVAVNLFRIKKDKSGVPFVPSNAVAVVLGILKLLLDFGYIIFMLIIVVLGAIAGYSEAVEKHEANRAAFESSIQEWDNSLQELNDALDNLDD